MTTTTKRSPFLPFLLLFALFVLILYRFSERWLHLVLLYLSKANWARQIVSKLSVAQMVAMRFVAGTTIAEAMTAAKDLNAKGMKVTLDFLGESVNNPAEARAARDEILAVIDAIAANGINGNVSVKLTQLGLRVDESLALDNVRRLLERAQIYNNKVRIDMEESAVTDVTLGVYRRLRDELGFGHRVGIVIQSYLYRSEEDVAELVENGAWVRLCKGAYAEPADVAFAAKADTDRNYVKLTELMLSETARQKGVYLGVATHDEKMIQATLDYVKANGISPQEFEFQMLYGIRRELQEKLVADGYQVRVYVPYGTAWYPYFMRRLAERPANLWFFISNFLRS
ncbi:MAG: proline dehydrogenase family protein [Chloroflexi bacterium]|nr:proline dehydrogenase family protein [Chloroflexota bacterium]MBK7179169.1 proline dehydrogenase family protein [Chloroflexota bacterium]